MGLYSPHTAVHTSPKVLTQQQTCNAGAGKHADNMQDGMILTSMPQFDIYGKK